MNTDFTMAKLTGFGLVVAIGSLPTLFLSAFAADRWWLRILIVTIGALSLDWHISRRSVDGRRVTVAASAPADATAGVPSVLWLSVQAPRTPLTVAVPVLRSLVRVEGAEEGTIEVTYPWRGRVTDLEAVVMCTGPLGLFRAARHTHLALPNPLFVGPPPEAPREGFRPPTNPSDGLDNRIERVGRLDLLRGARPYRPGDRMHHIHWPATARGNGQPMVREFDALRSLRLIIVVDLGPAIFAVDVERVARQARWLCEEALRQRLDLDLVTVDNHQTVWAPVHTGTQAARRLTDATPGTPVVDYQRQSGGLFLFTAGTRQLLPCLSVCPTGVFS